MGCRNGRTGELLLLQRQEGLILHLPICVFLASVANERPGTLRHQLHARAHRAVLQNALLREVDQSRIVLASKLTNLHRNNCGSITLSFANRPSDEADLVIGADGIRSVRLLIAQR